MTKRTGLIAIILLIGGAAAFLWLDRPKPVKIPLLPATPAHAIGASESVAGGETDYREDFKNIEWTLITSSAPFDKRFGDAAYCDHYLACLISAGDLEWGAFITQNRMDSARGGRFLELTARKKLAVKQAAIAARAFGPEVSKRERDQFLQEVSGEHDRQIKEVLGAKLFSLYLTSRRTGVVALEPFFIAAQTSGFELNADQEAKLIAGIAVDGLSRKTPPGRDGFGPILTFDAPAEKNLPLSLDQLVEFRKYQQQLRLVRSVNSSEKDLRDPAIGSFVKFAMRELAIDPTKGDALHDILEKRAAGAIASEEFRSKANALMNSGTFENLVALARKSAVERDIGAIARRIRAYGLGLNEEETKELRKILETDKLLVGGHYDFLPEAKRGPIERYMRARYVAQKIDGKPSAKIVR